MPFNDLKRRPAVDRAVARVLERGWHILGPEVEAFEAEFAAYCGAGACVGVGNGTDAIELALRAAGVKAGDEVATVANAGMYATTAIRSIGARPLYIDVDGVCGLMSPASLDGALGWETRAIVATHLYGRMAPMRELLEVARRRGIPIVEDCAQAHGAASEGRKAGTWGLAGCFSFYPTKNLGACGDAGAVITADAGFAGRVRALRQYGWTAKYDSTLSGGRNSRLDEMQAAILRDRLPLLDEWNRRRREIAGRYDAAFRRRLATPYDAGSEWAAHLYVVRTPGRDELRRRLELRGIRTEIHYPIPDHRQTSQRGLPGRAAELAETERLAGEVLSLPCFPEMEEAEIEAVINGILEWCP